MVARFDQAGTGLAFWWRMQERITSLQRKEAGAVEPELPFSLMYEFNKKYGGKGHRNVDCVLKVLQDTAIQERARAREMFGRNWEPSLSWPDNIGRVFLQFENDQRTC